MYNYRAVIFPQLPGEPFYAFTNTYREASEVANTLASFQLFLFENKIMPDYSNAVFVEKFIDGDWEGWEDEDEEQL